MESNPAAVPNPNTAKETKHDKQHKLVDADVKEKWEQEQNELRQQLKEYDDFE